MIDTHLNNLNFEEVSPPYIVKDDALYGTGQLPKFSEDLFHTTDNRWLIPTSEVPLTNIVSNEIIDKKNYRLGLLQTLLVLDLRQELQVVIQEE